ncbi:MAG: energy-coupling factor ABC transporter ATP-binding protein [Synergistaceae bacterium]|jgi:cobalt/nickel transport system ATP-binding protein|nr:energy-coupling factor ABC transporter ATP-binding protein [Synergistaceae bacterium]
MSPIIETRNLSYNYPDGTTALNGVSLRIYEYERVGLIGANGSGKSTLLMLLSGSFKHERGEILLNGSEIGDIKRLRDASGMVCQEPDDQLFMPSVVEDVAFGLAARHIGVETAHSRAVACLERLGAAHLRDRPPHRMSGGEKRIVALAGILVMEPKIIMLDEPTSSLDPRARREVTELLRGLGVTMIISTHDMALAKTICGRLILMQAGQIRLEGKPEDILGDEVTLRQYGL